MKIFRKACRRCGEAFETPASNQLHCSVECTVAAKVLRLGLPQDVCWPWPKSFNKGGYGTVRRDKKLSLTHRAAYRAFHGPIPDGMYVLHECDNPPCCNPHHLFLGTHKDNMDDMDRKGRRSPPRMIYGEEHHEARLDKNAVLDILARWQAGQSMRAIGRHYRVTHEAVRKVVRGETWRHVTNL